MDTKKKEEVVVSEEEKEKEEVVSEEGAVAAQEPVDNEDEKVEELAKALIDKVGGFSQEAARKKAAVFGEGHATSTEARVKIYTKKDNKTVVDLPKSKAELLGKWFKSYLRMKNGDMGYYQSTLDIVQKLEPLRTDSATEGGNLVPTILTDVLVPIIEDMATIRPNARIIDLSNTPGGTFDIPQSATKPIVGWSGEFTQKSTTSATFSKVSLTPYVLAGILPITQQMLDDSPFNVVQLVSTMLGEAIAREEDKAFMTGDGSGKPTGIDNYTFPIVNAGGAGDFTHLNSAYFRLPQAYRSRAFWIMNAHTMGEISNMVDAQSRPILQQDIYADMLPRLKNRPVLENNNIANGKIFLIDLSMYWIGEKRGITLDTAKEATIAGFNLFERNALAVRVEERLDGEMVNTRAAVEIQNF